MSDVSPTRRVILIAALVLVFSAACEEPADEKDRVISQKHTGLQWLRCSLTSATSVDMTDSCETLHWAANWGEAVDACENLTFAGKDDWRLPNVRELQSLVRYDRLRPAIDDSLFPGTNLFHYWTSTSYGTVYDSEDYAYIVDFWWGNIHIDPKDLAMEDRCFVRCVRGPGR